jgi:hypothetical protein
MYALDSEYWKISQKKRKSKSNKKAALATVPEES